MSPKSPGRGGRPSRRRGPRGRLISLKRVERLELLNGLPKLAAQVISPRRESSRRLRILEVVGHEGLTLLRRVPETSRKVEVAEHPEPHRGVEELSPVEVGVLPIGYRLYILLREEVLHAVVDLLVRQGLEVVLFVEPPVSSVEPRLRDAQPDIDLVLPLRKYPSVPGCRDVLVEVDETVFRSEVCLVLRPSVELQDVPSRRLDVIHIDLPL